MYDSATSETTTYEYDLYGNLLSVGLPDGRTIEYDVDGAGRRVGRRELDPSGNEISFRGWIYRDLLRPIAEVNALGEVVARYVYSDGSGARQNGVGQLATRLGANQDTSLPFSGSNVPEAIELLDSSGAVTQTLMLSTNQVGSVQLVTDASTGEVLQRIEYDEFGRVLADSAPGMQPFGFAGGLYDVETELVRFGARDYSAEVGRWIARDPVRFGGGQENIWIYVNNDPVNLTDGSGFGNKGVFGGKCCNNSEEFEFALTGEGSMAVRPLPPGHCSGWADDCDGMTCNGKFRKTSDLGYGECNDDDDDSGPHGRLLDEPWSPGCESGESPGFIVEGKPGKSSDKYLNDYDWDACGCP